MKINLHDWTVKTQQGKEQREKAKRDRSIFRHLNVLSIYGSKLLSAPMNMSSQRSRVHNELILWSIIVLFINDNNNKKNRQFSGSGFWKWLCTSSLYFWVVNWILYVLIICQMETEGFYLELWELFMGKLGVSDKAAEAREPVLVYPKKKPTDRLVTSLVVSCTENKCQLDLFCLWAAK